MVGLSSGLFFALYNLGVILAAPTQDSVTITSDGEWNSGTTDDITVGSGAIEISGDGGTGWFDTDWSFRKGITLTNTGSIQTNYQTRIAVTYDSDMQADFDDLRFANTSGTELDYWLQSKIDSTTAVIWVEVDSLAGSGDTTVYMYYGNGAASSGSDGETTFQFFDDFEDGTIDADKWTEVDQAGGDEITESGGLLKFTRLSNDAWDKALYTDTAFSRADLSFEMDYEWTQNNTSYDALMMGWKDNTGDISYTNLVYGYYSSGNGTPSTVPKMVYEDGSNRSGVTGSWTISTDYDVRIRMRASGGAYYEESTDSGENWNTSYTTTYSTESSLHPGFTFYTGSHEFDNTRIRKWMATEPSVSFGSEESALESPGTYTSHNLDVENIYSWGDCTGSSCTGSSTAFTTNVVLPANTTALFEMRHSANGFIWLVNVDYHS